KSAGRLKVGVVLARSCTLSAFALFVDTRRLASDEQDRSGRFLADWQVIGSTRHLITASCGVQAADDHDVIELRRNEEIGRRSDL
ncbi:GlxA family transcriptional regulator, partial [Rhizobium ruizarguesonis]